MYGTRDSFRTDQGRKLAPRDRTGSANPGHGFAGAHDVPMLAVVMITVVGPGTVRTYHAEAHASAVGLSLCRYYVAALCARLV